MPVFDIELNEAEDGLDRTPPRFGGRTHRYVFLVFKLKGYINVPEAPSGCTEDYLTERTTRTHQVLQETYDLEGPVAGTFARTGHSRYISLCLSLSLPHSVSLCLSLSLPVSLCLLLSLPLVSQVRRAAISI